MLEDAEEKARDRQRKACRTQQLVAQVQQACLTPGSVHSSTRARGGAHTQGDAGFHAPRLDKQG